MVLKRYLRFLLVLLSLVLWQNVNAQQFPVQVTPVLAPPYSIYLADYASADGNLQLIINLLELDRPQYKVKLRITIEGQGIVIRTKSTYKPPQAIILQGGVAEMFTGADIKAYFNPDNLDFSGISKSEFVKTGALPEGFYTFKFEVIDFVRDVVVSNQGFGNAWLILNDPPIINLPFNNEKIAATDPQNVTFSWTPRHTASPNSAFTTEYKFTLVELYPDNRNPNDAIRSAKAIYTTTTSLTSLNYGMTETLLIPGRKYAFRVQAVDTDGKDLFKNNGFSEVFVFQFGDACIPPPGVKAEALDEARIKVTWDQIDQHTSFGVHYRKKGGSWNDQSTLSTSSIVPGLQPNTAYEFQVKGTCGTIQGQYSTLLEVKTLAANPQEFVCGAPGPKIEIKTTPLQRELLIGDIIKTADFDVIVTEAEANPDGSYKGKGKAMMPWFKLAMVSVKFSSIKVNDDLRVFSGNVTTVYTASSRFIANIDATGDDGPGESDTGTPENAIPQDTIIVDVDVKDVTVGTGSGGGSTPDVIVIVAENGATQEIPREKDEDGNYKDTLVKDKNGDTWIVDKEGSVRQGGSTAGPETIASLDDIDYDVTFKAVESQSYGFDLNEKATGAEKIQIRGRDYEVAWKSIETGAIDRVNAIAGDEQTFPSVVGFKANGVELPKQPGSDESEKIIMLSGKVDGQEEPVSAYVLVKEKEGEQPKEVEIGRLNVKTYDKIRNELIIVPVNDAGNVPDASALQEELNKIYKQAVVEWSVTVAMPFKYSKEELKGIDSEESDFLSSFPEKMEIMNRTYKNSIYMDGDAYYLFIVEGTGSKRDGFMPFKKRFGYIFSDGRSPEQIQTTIAHELGHGAFRLRHTFSPEEFKAPEGSTANLMDYNNGTELKKYQWDLVHDPASINGWTEDDDEASDYTARGLFKNWDFGANKDETYTFLTPSGDHITLPKNVEDVRTFFGYYGTSLTTDEKMYRRFLATVPGSLFGFKIADRVFSANIISSGDGFVINGYFDQNNKPYAYADFKIDIKTSYESKALLMAFGPFKDGDGFYIQRLNTPSAGEFKGGEPLRDALTFPVHEVSSMKKYGYEVAGTQVSVTPEILSWAFTGFTEAEQTYLIRNKVAELKALYPRFMDEITSNYGQWNADNVCPSGFAMGKQFENSLLEKYCTAHEMSMRVSDYSTQTIKISTYERNDVALPANQREWLTMFYGYLKIALEEHRKQVDKSILELNANPKLIDQSDLFAIVKMINSASQNDISKLEFEVVVKVMCRILNTWVREDNMLGLDYEGAMLKLLSNVSPTYYGALLATLEGKNIYDQDEFLMQQMFNKVHDETNLVFFSVGNNNRLKMVAHLTKMVLADQAFYNEKLTTAYENLGDRCFILEYNNFLIQLGKSLLHDNVIVNIVDAVSDNSITNSLKTYDVSYDWLPKENMVKVRQYQEQGFYEVSGSKPVTLGPFDLVFFINRSNLSAVKELMSDVKATDVPLPAITLLYATDKAGEETINDGIATAIDIASLAASGGGLAALRGAGLIYKARKALMITDMASSGLSLLATASKDYAKETNSSVSQVLQKLSAITGLVSMSSLGVDQLAKIKSKANLAEAINEAKALAESAGDLPTKQGIEEMMTTFSKLDDTQILRFVKEYPFEASSAMSIAIKYLKDGVDTRNALKITEAKALLTKIGLAVKNGEEVVNFLAKFDALDPGIHNWLESSIAKGTVKLVTIDGTTARLTFDNIEVGKIKIENGVSKLQANNLIPDNVRPLPEEIKHVSDDGRYAIRCKSGVCDLETGACFTAGTLVHTNEGKIPIEDVVAGDAVFGYDHHCGERVLSEVVQTTKRTWYKLYRILSGRDTIYATPSHPFYEYSQKRYIAADSLRKGMKLLTMLGASLVVNDIQAKDTIVTVYNFEVEHQHNYFVGTEGYLVHNANKDCFFSQLGISDDINETLVQKIEGFTADQKKAFKSDLNTKALRDEITKAPDLATAWHIASTTVDAVRKNPKVLQVVLSLKQKTLANGSKLDVQKLFDNGFGRTLANAGDADKVTMLNRMNSWDANKVDDLIRRLGDTKYSGLAGELSDPDFFKLYDDIIHDPDNALDIAKQAGDDILSKVSKSTFFNDVTVKGKKFEEDMLKAVLDQNSNVYKNLNTLIPDLADRKVLSQVHFCVPGKSLPCNTKGDYFIADIVFVKYNARGGVADMIIADSKLSQSTNLTSGQQAAKNATGGSLTMRSLEISQDALKTALPTTLTAGAAISHVGFYKIYGNGSGVFQGIE
jgi:hypothetical protein